MAARAYAFNLPKLFAIRLLFWMHFFAAVLVPFFTDWGGITLQQVFFLNAWFFLCSFLFEVPTGAVADFLGRKWSLALGSAVAVSGLLLYAAGKTASIQTGAKLAQQVIESGAAARKLAGVAVEAPVA